MNITDLSKINVSPTEPPEFSFAYLAALLLASNRKGAVVERFDSGCWIEDRTPVQQWAMATTGRRRIQPGSIIGSLAWFEKVPAGRVVSLQFENMPTMQFKRRDENVWDQVLRNITNTAKTADLVAFNHDDWQLLPAAPEPMKHSLAWFQSLPVNTVISCKLGAAVTIKFQRVVAGWKQITGTTNNTLSLEQMVELRREDWVIEATVKEPVKHSREWAQSLDSNTSIWHISFTPNLFWRAFDLRSVNSSEFTGGWYIVGTSEWANALPEGTEIVTYGGTVIRRDGDQWRTAGSSFFCWLKDLSGFSGGGFKLHVPAVAPFWSRPSDIPVEAADGWFRLEGILYRLTEIRPNGLRLAGPFVAFTNHEVMVELCWSPSHLGPWLECRVEGRA